MTKKFDGGAQIFHVAKNFNEYFEPAEILKKLCDFFSDYEEIDARDSIDATPLLRLIYDSYEPNEYASIILTEDRLECIHTLINADADLSSEDFWGHSFMNFINDESYTNENEFKSIICDGKCFLDKLVFIDILHTFVESPKSQDIEILISALGQDKNKIAKALLNGSSIEAKTKRGYTPLMLASMFGTPETVKFLVDNGADINAKDKYGNNAVALAVVTPRNNYENIRLLAELGVDINSRNNDGSTPIKQAITSEFGEGIKKLALFIELGCSIYNVNNDGDNALTFAANNGKCRAVKTILLAGINPKIL